MRLLPQLADVDVTVTFYGTPPDDTTSVMLHSTTTPLLIIHGANDAISPIANIYEYAILLDAANVPFELKVYADEEQGFMLRDGLLREDALAQDAFTEMLSFLHRHLR
jgi:dienelactone hydrolase